jgi:chemotaxis protein methyltransferase CheR
MNAAREELRSKMIEIIRDETGIMIHPERTIDLDIVIDSRLIFHNMAPEKYLSFASCNYNEIVYLASCFTIQETSFYRNRNHFDRLRLEIFPALIAARTKEKRIRILSAGCATGEEPYTIAMILCDLLPDMSAWKIEITATDIHDDALSMALEGVYSRYKLRNIDQSYITRYFTEVRDEHESKIAKNLGGHYRIADSIKRMVSFRHTNLIREPFELSYLSGVDIILCENVIIYFCIESIQRLIENFYDLLVPGGWLFLGYSETLNVVRHRFALSWWKDSYAYVKQKKSAGEVEESAPRIGTIESEPGIPLPQLNLSYTDLIKLVIESYKNGLTERVYTILKALESDSFTLDETFYVLKAEYCFDQNDNINAANECRKAINKNPFCIDAHLLLGAIYLDIDMFDSAIFEIKTALYINNDNILANYFCSLYNKKIECEAEYLICLDRAKKMFLNSGNLGQNIFPANRAMENTICAALLGPSG